MRLRSLVSVAAVVMAAPACVLVLGDFDKGSAATSTGTGGSGTSTGSTGGVTTSTSSSSATTSSSTGGLATSSSASTGTGGVSVSSASSASSASGGGSASSSTTSTTTSSSSTSSTSSSGAPTTLYVEYECGSNTSPTSSMMPYFKIVNGGTTSVALSGLTIRYYFTQDTSSGQLFQCDFAMPPLVCSTLMPGNNNVIGTFVTMPMSTWTTTADHYLELSFPASTETIVPNGDTGEIEVASVDKNYDNVFYQNNDYSYNGGALTAYVIWNQVTLYQNGLLVWGVPP